MTKPEAQLLQLFQQAVPRSFFEDLCREQGYQVRRGIYSMAVVVWLMIWQQLQKGGTLAAAVQALLQGQAGTLVDPCARVLQKKISAATGGYCQARQKLPTLVAIRVADRLVEQLRGEMQEGWPGLQRPTF